MFEFSDASGMSYRTTDKVGVAAATGDGGEGSPIEIDPLGGSVGMFTPYITLSGGAYTPRYPDLIQPYDVSEPSGPDFSSLYATFGSRTADLPGFGTNWGSFADFGEIYYDQRVAHSQGGEGFLTDEEAAARRAAVSLSPHEGGGHAGQTGDGVEATTSEELTAIAEEGGDSSTLVDTHLAGLYDSSVTVSAGGNWDSVTFGPDYVDLPKDFRSLVEARLKSVQPKQTIDCNTFLSNVIAKVVEIANNEIAAERKIAQPGSAPLTDFTLYGSNGFDLLKSAKITLVPGGIVLPDGSVTPGTVAGSIAGGNAEVKMQRRVTAPPPPPLQKQRNDIINWYIHTVIHELAHLSSGAASDGRLAQAANLLGYGTTRVADPRERDQMAAKEHSTTWDGVLSDYCGGQ
jgi:hypothetical protein